MGKPELRLFLEHIASKNVLKRDYLLKYAQDKNIN